MGIDFYMRGVGKRSRGRRLEMCDFVGWTFRCLIRFRGIVGDFSGFYGGVRILKEMVRRVVSFRYILVFVVVNFRYLRGLE